MPRKRSTPIRGVGIKAIRVHKLIRGGTRVMRAGRQAGNLEPDIREITGGTVVYRARTYGDCWAHLRELVDLGAIPYDSCMAAMKHEYAIHPPPQCRDGIINTKGSEK